MFTDRFEGSAVQGANRPRLSFESRLALANTLKDEWAFVWDDSIRYNIAYALQDVQFGVLLVNEYNVYWTPEAMIFKHAIVQIASVVEAVLQYDLKYIEDDPRMTDALGKDWVFIDSKEVPLPGIEIPDGQRAVMGLQRLVPKETLDRNSKMQVLIRVSRKLGIIEQAMADELDELRKLRNRIHIKSLDAPECDRYTAAMANGALDLLERYRQVAYAWTVNQRIQNATAMSNTLHAQAEQPAGSADDDIDWGSPSVVPPESAIPDFGPSPDDIPF